MSKQTHPTDRQMVRAAKRLHHDECVIEIDDNAKVSRADDNSEQGAYVQAWIWVPDDETKSEVTP